MRRLLIGLTLCTATAHTGADRGELLDADRALAAAIATSGRLDPFLSALGDSAFYLHPDAPLLRGRDSIRAFLDRAAQPTWFTWSPAYADVSADGTLGYTYGYIRATNERGKYLACWRKLPGGWRLTAFVRSHPSSPPTAASTPPLRRPTPSRPVPGRSDPAELIQADAAFAAMSVAHGVKPSFVAFAAEDAILFGSGPFMNEGREAIGAAFDGFPAGAVLEWWPVAADVARSGDLGCTVGEARVAARGRYSKYLTIWKRQPDGTWKYVADGGNARPAP